MKISWPWLKKKLLSLFEKPIAAWSYNSTGNENRTSKMPIGPHPLNASGPFYVENDECIACGAPHAVAPDVMAWTEDPNTHPGRTHCYFKKQPQDEVELRQALDAIAASCCGAIRYAGSDKEVLRELRKNGNANAIIRK
jgi:ferredoxin